MKLFFSFLLIALCSSLIYGQASRKPKPKPTPTTDIISAPTVDVAVAGGKFSAQRYENWFLGFSIVLPAGWQRLDDAVNDTYLEQGSDLLRQNKSKTTLKALEKSFSNTRVLFQFVPPSGGAVLAAGIEQVPSGFTSRAYAASNLRLSEGAAGFRVIKDIYERPVGGKLWQAYELEMTTFGQKLNQLYLMRVENKVALFFVTTLGDPAQAKALTDSLNTLKFDR